VSTLLRRVAQGNAAAAAANGSGVAV
jgi:hypothetical protein